MSVLQPYARFIPARILSSDILHIPVFSVSASADITISASVRLGSRGSAVLPLITINPVVRMLNVSASADISLAMGTVRLGSKASAIIGISSVPTVSKQNIVTASAILPLISMSQRITAAASLPLLSIAAVASTVSAATSVAWITNLSLEETTKFTNFGFINIVRIGNNIYGVKSNGLYLLGASTDNGTSISSHIKTHPNNYKQQTFKRIPYMYIQTQYPVAVTEYIDSETIGPMTTDHGQQKVTMSKGTQGYYWSYKIANVAPNSFKIDGIEPFIDFMKRRA